MKYRYTIILDREDNEDWGPEQMSAAPIDDRSLFHDGTDEKAIAQVAAELQEAMDESGLPAGFFHIVSREKLPLGTPYPDGEKAL